MQHSEGLTDCRLPSMLVTSVAKRIAALHFFLAVQTFLDKTLVKKSHPRGEGGQQHSKTLSINIFILVNMKTMPSMFFSLLSSFPLETTELQPI